MYMKMYFKMKEGFVTALLIAFLYIDKLGKFGICKLEIMMEFYIEMLSKQS